MMSTFPLFTPVTVAYPQQSLSTRATDPLPLVNAKSTLAIACVSVPTTRHACAYTETSWPRKTTWAGACRVTKTLSLLSLGKAQVTPASAAAMTTKRIQFSPYVRSEHTIRRWPGPDSDLE